MKRPVILEGDTARNFTAKRIYVRPANGGALIPFVPEDEVTLTTKSINENGVYQASRDGAYGWSSVTVNVPENTSVTGTGPDGKQHTVTTDPETGELQDQITPVSIVVTVPPNILQYQHGDTIDFTGIVVHAYDSDGVDLGEVPFGELVFPVTVAVEQTIPVEWPRTGDGAVLEASFSIYVSAVTGGGGQAGGDAGRT